MPYIKHYAGDLSSLLSLILRRIAAIRSINCCIFSEISFFLSIFLSPEFGKFESAIRGNPARAFVGKADHRLAVELRGKRLGQRRSKHGSADRTACDTVQKVVVARLRLEFPLIDRAAAPLCFDAVFGG